MVQSTQRSEVRLSFSQKAIFEEDYLDSCMRLKGFLIYFFSLTEEWCGSLSFTPSYHVLTGMHTRTHQNSTHHELSSSIISKLGEVSSGLTASGFILVVPFQRWLHHLTFLEMDILPLALYKSCYWLRRQAIGSQCRLGMEKGGWRSIDKTNDHGRSLVLSHPTTQKLSVRTSPITINSAAVTAENR